MKVRLLPLLILMVAPQAWGGDYYWELGAGASQLQGTEGHFGADGAGTPTMGPGLNFSIVKNLSRNRNFFQFHFGIKNRHSTSTTEAGMALQLNTLYPFLRFHMGRLYVGGGFTPFVLSRSSPTLGPAGLAVGSDQSIPVEVGYVWRVVPFFFLALEAGGEMLIPTGTLAISGTLQMRFIWWDKSTKKRQGEFDGWRYPFGIGIYDQ